MKKIYIFMCVIIVLSLLTGASKKDVIKHNYTYKGENKHWKAEYKVNETVIFTKKNGTLGVDSASKHKLTVIYKGKLQDLSTVKHWEISYDSIHGGGGTSEDCSDGKGIKSKILIFKSSSNGAISSKDDIIKVTINIDGHMQKLKLKVP